MSVWHLLWILPLAFSCGFVLCAAFAAGAESKQVSQMHRELNRLKEERDHLLYAVDWYAEGGTAGAEITE